MPSDNSADPRPEAGHEAPKDDDALTTPASAGAHLTELTELLNADRERTLAQISALDQDFTSIVQETRLSATDDEHDPEGSTIAFERSQTSALLTAATHHLAEVDAALAKIAAGSYGRCERCDEPIAHERLLARPAARTCIACAS